MAPHDLSRLEAVLFDFDGVMCDTEPLGVELDQRAFRALGLEVSDEEAATVVGTDGIETVAAILANHGRGDVSIDQFKEIRGPSSQIYATMDLSPMEGAPQLLASLRAQGIKVGLVSTTAAHNLLFALDRLGLLSAFDVIVAGDMVQRVKPDSEPWERALAWLGVDAERALAVDDSPTGIASAKAAGLRCVGFAGSTIPQDTSAADVRVVSFAELAEVIERERG